MVNVLSLVSYPFLPARFGGQKAIAGFYHYLSAGVNLYCVTTKKNDPGAADGYPVLNILSDSPLRYINPFYFFTLRKIIREKKITHLLLEHPYYGWLGILLKRYTGVKLVIRSHNIEGLRWKTLGKWWWKWLWKYERKVHRAADLNFFIHEGDLNYAIRHFNLDEQYCILLEYGIDQDKPPSAEEKSAARDFLVKQYKIPKDHFIFLYNGSFGYLPNLNALKKILFTIYPELVKKQEGHFTIIICGKGIPGEITAQTFPAIIFAGFVEDIATYFKGADVFLNPTLEGGGIKTKIVEAIGYGTTVVSTVTGAAGINEADCGTKLLVVPDDKWGEFASGVIKSANDHSATPATYYERYYWKNIIREITIKLESQI